MKGIAMCYVYILLCSDGSLYTGWTIDIERRFRTHSQGKASKYTRARLPVKLVYLEEIENKIDAQKREWAIKKFSRKQKLELIESKSSKTDLNSTSLIK